MENSQSSVILKELDGIKIHIKLNDYPQIFKMMLINGVIKLFSNNKAIVKKQRYSNVYEISSNKNIAREIDGLEILLS